MTYYNYTVRGECMMDILGVAKACYDYDMEREDAMIMCIDSIISGDYDITMKFKSCLTLDKLIYFWEHTLRIDDIHVMIESVDYASRYTGGRRDYDHTLTKSEIRPPKIDVVEN